MIHCHALACLSLKSMGNKEDVKFSNKIYAWEYGKSKNGMGEFPGSPVLRLSEPLGGEEVYGVGKTKSPLLGVREGRRSIQNLNSIMFYSLDNLGFMLFQWVVVS